MHTGDAKKLKTEDESKQCLLLEMLKFKVIKYYRTFVQKNLLCAKNPQAKSSLSPKTIFGEQLVSKTFIDSPFTVTGTLPRARDFFFPCTWLPVCSIVYFLR